MDNQLSHLTQKIWKSHLSNPNHRLIIGVSGVPGSGKTTLAKLLVLNLNSLSRSQNGTQPEIAILVPMDGYHLTRKQLDAFPDPVEAHARRGARWTFDAEGFVDLVRRVRNQPLASTDDMKEGDVLVPSFSHAIKDPIADDIHVKPHHKIVVFEGLYLALNIAPWNVPILNGWYDEIWFATVDKLTARERLAKRHLAAGIVQTIEDGRKRAIENDEVNGDEILEFLDRQKVSEIIESKEDEKWITTDGG